MDHVIFGGGFPVALQNSSRSLDSFTVLLVGPLSMLGGTTKKYNMFPSLLLLVQPTTRNGRTKLSTYKVKTGITLRLKLKKIMYKSVTRAW